MNLFSLFNRREKPITIGTNKHGEILTLNFKVY